MISRPLMNNPLIRIPLLPRLIPSLCRRAPWRHRNSIALRFPSSTTMRMIASIHRDASNRRPDIQPPTPARLAQLPKVPMRITDRANRRTRIPRHLPHLPALQSHSNPPRMPALILRHDNRIRARAPAKHGTSLRRASHTVHLRTQWHEMQRKTVSPKSRLCSQHPRIQHPSHTL